MQCLEMAPLLQWHWLKNNSRLPQVMGQRPSWGKGILLVCLEVTQLLKSCFEGIAEGSPEFLGIPSPEDQHSSMLHSFCGRGPRQCWEVTMAQPWNKAVWQEAFFWKSTN